MLFKMIKNATGNKRLTRLRISYIEIDDRVLMNALVDMIKSLDHLIELNLKAIQINGKAFSQLMQTIQENLQMITYLNLSYNTLP